MLIKQLYTGCLSEAAYFIASGSEAAVIDPIRDTEEYLELAKEHGVKIKYIFETHFHADFVSGHLDLSEKTGAPIIYGPNTQTRFPIHLAKDGETFRLGKLTLEVIHTPGHTLESTCYLLKDEEGKPHCIFTGDTLFVGDVGRPDLSSGNLDKEELAGHLYDSVQKLKNLPEGLLVYPAHGPGSACGKNLGPETSSSIGIQKETNYAMKAEDKEAFIKNVIQGLEPPPSYFKESARINKEGYTALDELMKRSNQPLELPDFLQKVEEGVWILDTRPPEVFSEGFIPAAINIGLEGRFAAWVGMLIPFHQPIVLVTVPGEEEETIVRMARVGFDQVTGYLEGGMEAWKNAGKEVDLIINVDPDELAMDMPFDKNLSVIDVRKPLEFANGHVQGAINLPLDDLMDPVRLAPIEDHHNLYVHCESGYRSVIACSLIKRQGFHNLRNVTGGFIEIKDTTKIKLGRAETVLN